MTIKYSLAGLLFMALGMALIPVGDAIAKSLSASTSYTPQLIAWVRFLLGGAIMIPFAFKSDGLHSVTRQLLIMQTIRGILIVLTVVFIIHAVSLSPIADVFGAFFIGPVLTVILSVVLLREHASTAEWISVAVGFMGVLMVVQPGVLMQLFDIKPIITASTSADMDNAVQAAKVQSSGVYWALLAGIFYGSFLVATRWAASSGPPLMQVTLQFLIAALILTPFALPELINTGILMPVLLLCMGISSVLANLFSVMALSRASAAALAPVVYVQIVAATIIGLLFFEDKLNPLAAAGLAVIILSGLLKIRR